MSDEHKRVIGIDNDQGLGPPVGIKHGHYYLNLRSILLLLPSWNEKPLESGVLRTLKRMKPAHLILEWLRELRDQNKKYETLRASGWLTEQDCEDLALPITLPLSSITETYRLLVKLKQIARQEPATRWEIFETLYPPIATLYEKLLEQTESDPLETQNLLFPQGSLCWLEELIDDNDPLFEQIIALAPTDDDPPQTPLGLAQQWLATCPLDHFPRKTQKDLLTKALATFPEWQNLTLLKTTLKSPDLAEVAEMGGQLQLITLIQPARITKNGILGMLASCDVVLVDTDLDSEAIKTINAHAETIGREFDLQNSDKELSSQDEVSNALPPKGKEEEEEEDIHPLLLAANQGSADAKEALVGTSAPPARDLKLESSDDLNQLHLAVRATVGEAFAEDTNLIQQLANNLPGTLNELDLSHTDITDANLTLLIEAMPNDPIYFSLKGCTEITSKSLDLLITTYRLSAEKENAHGQFCLGNTYAFAQGIEQDLPKCVRLYRLAADQELAIAQYNLANCYEYGHGVQKNHEETVRLHKLAAEQGNADAQYELGRRHWDGSDVEKNQEKAVQFYRLAAAQGLAAAQSALGSCYEKGDGVKQDSIKAARLYKFAADQGSAVAQYNLAILYEDGEGVKKSFEKAVELYKLAADQGLAVAQHNLAICYESGQGVNKDLMKAIRFYKLAAYQGFDEAQKTLSELKPDRTLILKSSADLEQLNSVFHVKVTKAFAKDKKLLQQLANKLSSCDLELLNLTQSEITDEGLSILVEGIRNDPIYFKLNAVQGLTKKVLSRLVHAYETFAKNDNPRGQVCLGLLHFYGIGVPENEKKAVNFYQRAADQGDAWGQTQLGTWYRDGTAVVQDLGLAKMFFKLAAKQGSADAQDFLATAYHDIEAKWDKSVRLHKLAADQGLSKGQYHLGTRYYFGKGVDTDPVEALRLYRLAADQEDAFAQCELGIWYHNGDVVKKNYRKSVSFYQLAAEQGDARAQYCLGRCYEDGHGVVKNRKKAIHFFSLAAKQGNSDACDRLACLWNENRNNLLFFLKYGELSDVV